MKLVRDEIPKIISKSGRNPVFRIANTEEYRSFLRMKLLEETNEFLQDENMEELADILEVIEAFCELNGYSMKELLKTKSIKRREKGKFRKRIILENISDN